MDWLSNNGTNRRLRAILTILLGLMAVFWSQITLGMLIIAFGIFAISDGIFVFFGGSDDKTRYLEGIVYVFLGVCVLAWPGISETLFVAIVVARMLVLGVFELFFWDKNGCGWNDGGLHWFSGVVNIGFGLYLFFGNHGGLWGMIQYIGIYWIIMGLVGWIRSRNDSDGDEGDAAVA